MKLVCSEDKVVLPILTICFFQTNFFCFYFTNKINTVLHKMKMPYVYVFVIESM